MTHFQCLPAAYDAKYEFTDIVSMSMTTLKRNIISVFN